MNHCKKCNRSRGSISRLPREKISTALGTRAVWLDPSVRRGRHAHSLVAAASRAWYSTVGWLLAYRIRTYSTTEIQMWLSCLVLRLVTLFILTTHLLDGGYRFRPSIWHQTPHSRRRAAFCEWLQQATARAWPVSPLGQHWRSGPAR